jgi:hypothetical protein
VNVGSPHPSSEARPASIGRPPQIEQGEFPATAGELQPNADSPDLFQFEGGLLKEMQSFLSFLIRQSPEPAFVAIGCTLNLHVIRRLPRTCSQPWKKTSIAERMSTSPSRAVSWAPVYGSGYKLCFTLSKTIDIIGIYDHISGKFNYINARCDFAETPSDN